jgi:hypothetical protein
MVNHESDGFYSLQGVSLENNILLYILSGMLYFLSSADRGICTYRDDWGYSFGLNTACKELFLFILFIDSAKVNC